MQWKIDHFFRSDADVCLQKKNMYIKFTYTDFFGFKRYQAQAQASTHKSSLVVVP
jgi:hypothetical protein